MSVCLRNVSGFDLVTSLMPDQPLCKRQTFNQRMGEWAPFPDEIDLPRYEETQQRWIQSDCPDGVMARLR